ncbi:MAG: M56 family metallopeptidase [Candidatus Thermoplasmatota archaeon]
MNEIILAIIIPIILTGLGYLIAEILTRVLNIKHPKNTFLVYLVVFIIAFSFIPLSFMSASEYNNNPDDLNIKNQIGNKSDKHLPNVSTEPYSSQLTPLYEKNDEQNLTGKSPSRFILKISWYNLKTVDETETKEETINDADKDLKKNEKDNFLASTIDTVYNQPPTLIFTSILIFLASLFLIYHFLIGKKHYLKKINAYSAKQKELLFLVKKISEEINIKTPKTYLYDGAPNAFVLGHPPILVISTRLSDVLTKDELKTTLRHELTHIKHHDVLLKSFIQAARIICFYNPFIHLVAKRIFNKRELLADSSYNISHGDKVSFMEALIKIAEYTQSLPEIEDKKTPMISLSLLDLTSYNTTITERFFSLFRQCKKKTVLTIIVSSIILFSNASAIIFTQQYFMESKCETESSTEEVVEVEKQYLRERVTLTTFYRNNEKYQGKMIHKTLYNIIVLPSMRNNSDLQKIIDYIVLKYSQKQNSNCAF